MEDLGKGRILLIGNQADIIVFETEGSAADCRMTVLGIEAPCGGDCQARNLPVGPVSFYHPGSVDHGRVDFDAVAVYDLDIDGRSFIEKTQVGSRRIVGEQLAGIVPRHVVFFNEGIYSKLVEFLFSHDLPHAFRIAFVFYDVGLAVDDLSHKRSCD